MDILYQMFALDANVAVDLSGVDRSLWQRLSLLPVLLTPSQSPTQVTFLKQSAPDVIRCPHCTLLLLSKPPQ